MILLVISYSLALVNEKWKSVLLCVASYLMNASFANEIIVSVHLLKTQFSFKRHRFFAMATSESFHCPIDDNCPVPQDKEALDKHVRGHYAKIIVNPSTRSIYLILPHEQMERGDDRMPKIVYQCLECIDHPENDARAHLRKVHGDVPINDFPCGGEVYKCGSCPQGGVRVTDIELHIQSHMKDIVCQHCLGRRFKKYKNFLAHHDRSCPINKNWSFDECPSCQQQMKRMKIDDAETMSNDCWSFFLCHIFSSVIKFFLWFNNIFIHWCSLFE